MALVSTDKKDKALRRAIVAIESERDRLCLILDELYSAVDEGPKPAPAKWKPLKEHLKEIGRK